MTPEGDIGVEIAVSIDHAAWRERLPDPEAHCRRAIIAALAGRVGDGPAEVSVLLTDDDRMTRLNAQFRERASSTNILSFPAAQPCVSTGETRLLGDLVLAYETVVAEAADQGKSVPDHVAHLLIHGALHLLGLDHQSDADAEHMEALEVGVLERLGIGNPYETPEIVRE